MSKVEEIAQILENAIVSGELPPGAVLRQDQLCEELGVSRTPVREALRQIAAFGLVTLEPNRGARVRVPSSEELREGYLIRARLEGLAAELAVDQMTRAELKELRAADKKVVQLTAALTKDKGELERRWLEYEWGQANLAFHDIIVDAARAPILARTARTVRLHGSTSRITWANPPELDPLYEQAVAQHREIVDAFAARDPRVGELVEQHILDSLTFVEAIFANIVQPRRPLLGSATRVALGGARQSAK